jgi:cyanate permease
MAIRIAVVDDSAAFVAAAAACIATLPGYVLAPTAETADMVLLDLGGMGCPAVLAMTLFHSSEAARAAT